MSNGINSRHGDDSQWSQLTWV